MQRTIIVILNGMCKLNEKSASLKNIYVQSLGKIKN